MKQKLGDMNFKDALCRMVDGKVMATNDLFLHEFKNGRFTVNGTTDVYFGRECCIKSTKWYEVLLDMPFVDFDTAFTALENGNTILLSNWPPDTFLKKEDGVIRRYPNGTMVVNIPLSWMRLKKWQIIPKDKEK